MTSERVIKQAPVPVSGWHCGPGGVNAAVRSAETGWSVYGLDFAAKEVDWAIENGTPVVFLMSDKSKIIVRAKK